MKKTVVLSLLLVFVLALSACSDQEEALVEEIPTETPAEEAPAEVPAEEAAVAPDEEAPAEAPAEEAVDEPPVEIESGLAPVDSVTVTQDGDQYVAIINGYLPDSCTLIAGTSQSVEGDAINISVVTQRPKDMMCAQSITTYTEEVEIDTNSLAEGEYTVAANDVAAAETVVVGESAAVPVDDTADSAEPQIVNIVWQWSSLEETDPAAQSVVPNPENYTVTLHHDGSVNIKADCNQLAVTYTVEGSSLVFNMLGPSTLAFCGEESLDTQFLALLGSVNTWALEDEQLKMSTTGGATMTFANGGPAPGSVGIDPNQISLDVQGLPYDWQAVVVPLQPYDTSMPPGPQGLPEHIQILFGVTDPAGGEFFDPIMYIIPVENYQVMYEANDNESVTNSMNKIAELTYALPEPAPTSSYPGLPHAPYTPIIGNNDLAVQLGRASADEMSASKNGYRFVGRWAQDANPVTNQNLFYNYQGFTNDGQYLVSFFYPVKTDQLPDDISGVTQEDMDTFNSDPQTHVGEMADRLNQLAASDWQPDLATLDALVGSLQIEGMVASGVQEKQWEWTSAQISGNEEQPVDNPTSYAVFYSEDGTFQFQADCNSGGGSYTVDGGFNGSLLMQAGPMTLAACPPESRSDEYLGYLHAAQDYRLQPGGIVMELVLPAGGGTIFFSEKGTADVELPDPEEGEATGTVIATAGANIRMGPSTNYASIGVAPFGATGTIIGVSQDRQWWAADVPDSPSHMGWVLASLIEAENADGVPVVPSPALPDPTPSPTPVPPPSATIKFWSDATVIREGECTALHWDVENIQAVWVYPQGSNYQNSPVSGNGSMSICPTQTTTYEMRVQHTDNSVEFRTVTVTVQPSNSLANTSWFVSSLYVNQVPLPGSSLTAFFSSSGSFSGNGGCNTLNGSYTVSGSSISIGPLASTRMSCGPDLDAQEQAYTSALQSASTYAISGSQLMLFDGAGQEVARFNFSG
jgi:heat shock protein HslJ